MKRNSRILLVLMAVINALLFYVLHFNTVDVDSSRDHYQIYQMIIKSNVFFEEIKHQDTSPQQNKEKVRNLLRKDTKIDGYFPVDGGNVCPYLGIRKIPYTKSNRVASNSFCKPRIPPQEECKKAYESYRIGEKPELFQEEQTKVDLCSVTYALTTMQSEVSVKCNLSPCGKNPVFVASIDPSNGELEEKKKWKEFFDVTELEASLPVIIAENTQNGIHFCFLRCLSASGKSTVKTMLMFPPQIRRKSGRNSNSLFNINVLVLDSVSRPHFYRSLPKTVKTLREISYNDSLNSTVLDYEVFQSLGPYTYVNIKAFFTGNSLYHAEKRMQQIKKYQYYYGFELFYKKLKEKGFYTMLQEDSCWHDVWGTVLANTRKDLSSDHDAEERKERWRQLLEEIQSSQIDDTGISFATCNVLQQYNVTNQFTKPKKVCYGRKMFFQYFLDYLEKLFSQDDEEDKEHKRAPIFSYTHFSIGHEYTGTRIKQADEGLSKYLQKLAEDQDTLTMMFSDHGPKTTDYSLHSKEGMYELYTPFLFIMIPEKIAGIIGEQRIKNLIDNQKRLITLKDVNGALMSILENDSLDKRKSPLKKEGIFSEIPENRQTCAKSHDTLCVCNGTEKWFPDNYVNFTWIAEFAIGEINNRIQRQRSKGMRSMNGVGGFGKCQRLVGKRFKNIQLREDDKNYYVTMDVTTSPVNEVFQVIVKYPMKPVSLKHLFKRKTLFARLLKFRRLSTYQHYYECKDANVSIQLCVCKRTNFQNAEARAKSHLWNWIVMNSPKAVHEVMRRQGNLGANQVIQNLDARCLVLITRSYGNHTLVYEVGNTCRGRRYIVRIKGHSVSKIQTSVSLPLTVDAKPLTLQFVLTVYHYRKPFDFVPSISFHILSY